MFSYAEHSGIYVGDDKIVHLDGSGLIEMISSKVFLDRLNGFSSGISIYVSCKGKNAVGNYKFAQRARSMVGKKRNYNLLLDNCHQFASGCITGDFENNDNFLFMLKHTAKEHLNLDTWRVWDRDD